MPEAVFQYMKIFKSFLYKFLLYKKKKKIAKLSTMWKDEIKQILSAGADFLYQTEKYEKSN